MKTTTFIVLCFSISTVLGACVSIDKKLEREFERISRGPSGSPYKTVTNFSYALSCMDKLMLESKTPKISVMVENLDDKTEEVKTGTRDMLISAISEMTTHSKAIKLIAYGKDTANLISFLKSANQDSVYKNVPVYDIQGSITQFDKSLMRADTSLGLFWRGVGGSGKAYGASLDVIALDLNVLSAADMSIVPGVTSSNSVAVFQRGDSLNTDASINKLGVYFDINVGGSEGKAQALRNLVELAAIELVGKLTKTPYGQCLGLPDGAPTEATLTHATPPTPTPTLLRFLNPSQPAPKKERVADAPVSLMRLVDGDLVRLKRPVSTQVLPAPKAD